jgi:hypothetical protein
MGLKWIPAAAVAGLSALYGCASVGFRSEAPVERLDESGLSAPALTVETGDVIEFHNGDRRPHQIYSSDCSELSSPLLRPTETFSAVLLGSGPKLCHFQDLLAPSSASYSGTIHVHDTAEERRLETSD